MIRPQIDNNFCTYSIAGEGIKAGTEQPPPLIDCYVIMNGNTNNLHCFCVRF